MNDSAAKGAPAEGAGVVNADNPWLGLASFTEETRAYFFGREEEVAELARRVQRKLLTVLFGQSGLGKTSILRAGIVPRLRAQGYCPIYVRIDYAAGTPEPAEQIKQAIRVAARRAGEWTQAGVAVEGESLWEYLHHRDDVLRDESGATLIPLLIFDQFEEIFTLAQSDSFGRARAARFITELADLVENRPPKQLEARFEEDESAAARFDFARSDYRVLIALREDYLAPLEGLKKEIPSISQNRLRLAPMTGTQALAAVLQPGGRLVSEEVAAAIVRFVAGGTELANAEVEPSLLSLICRELNDARIAQGRSEISLDLLAGSHATILSSFYERSLADQPPAVRRVIEDNLLTASGFRENVAEERLVKLLTEAGAAPGTLALLVNRRLLRIEERLDVRRVELTHDVLCGVVKASRDARQEREAREATERLLAEQRERELAARHALVRARRIAFGCTLLAVVALAAAVLAYFSGQRAHRAEREAQETRAMAEQARGQAEHLLGYLSDDFVRELESFGRLNVVAEFAQRQVDYFRALPPQLKGIETTRNAALALVYHSRAVRTLGNSAAASADANEAVRLLEAQRAAGDRSEATTLALALAYLAQSQVLDNMNEPGGPVAGLRAVEILKPLAQAPGASVAARRAYVEVLQRRGYQLSAANQDEEAVPVEREAMQIAASLGALDLSDLDMAAHYAEAGGWLVGSLRAIGQEQEAQRVGEEALKVADRLLDMRPGYRLAGHAQQLLVSDLAELAMERLDPEAAVPLSARSEQISLSMLKQDPNNIITQNNLGVAYVTTANALWVAGHIHRSLASYVQALEAFGHATHGGTGFGTIRAYQMALTAYRQAQAGDFAGAAATIATGPPYLKEITQREPAGSMEVAVVSAMSKIPNAALAFQSGDLPRAREEASAALKLLRDATPHGDRQIGQRHLGLFIAGAVLGQTEFLMGDYPAAEQALRLASSERRAFEATSVGDRREVVEVEIWLAAALARQGKLAEAAQIIDPQVAFLRSLVPHNRSDRWLAYELAGALYAQSLTDPQRRSALQREASTLLERLPPELRALRDVQWLRGLMAGGAG